MVNSDAIKRLSSEIARDFRPERIILFGSYAYGTPNEELADVDLLVVVTHQGKASAKAAEILVQTRPGFPVDIIVRSPVELDRRLAMNDFFIREIMEKGRLLFASADV